MKTHFVFQRIFKQLLQERFKITKCFIYRNLLNNQNGIKFSIGNFINLAYKKFNAFAQCDLFGVV